MAGKNSASDNSQRATAAALKALGHPTRLRILDMLATGEKCVCEILAVVDVSQSNVSQHLTVLRRAGVVDCYRKAQNVYYSLASQAFYEVVRNCREILGEPEPEQYIPMVDPCTVLSQEGKK